MNAGWHLLFALACFVLALFEAGFGIMRWRDGSRLGACVDGALAALVTGAGVLWLVSP